MSKLDKEYLELMVKRKQDDMRLKKIISIDCKPAISKGENFMSTMMRYELVVLLGSGETALKHVIAKSLPETKEHSEFLQEYSLFKNEIHMYSKILRDMKALMEEFQDKREPLWCELIAYKPYRQIILQDLRDHQFSTFNRRENLDIDHSIFVLKALGRFHALSAILLKRSLLRPSEFGPYTFCSEFSSNYFLAGAMLALAIAVKQTWGSEWSHLPDLLNKAAPKVYQDLQKLVQPERSRFNVINHGDSWTNNILFKHVEDTKIPAELRFVDYQLSHVNSFAWDVTYFMYSSIIPKLRHENYQQLLQIYHKSLSDNLKLYNYPENEIPSFQVVIEEMDRLKSFGMYTLFSIYSMSSSDSEDSFDMERSLKNPDHPELGFDISIFKTEKYKSRLQEDIKDFIKQKLL